MGWGVDHLGSRDLEYSPPDTDAFSYLFLSNFAGSIPYALDESFGFWNPALFWNLLCDISDYLVVAILWHEKARE